MRGVEQFTTVEEKSRVTFDALDESKTLLNSSYNALKSKKVIAFSISSVARLQRQQAQQMIFLLVQFRVPLRINFCLVCLFYLSH